MELYFILYLLKNKIKDLSIIYNFSPFFYYEFHFIFKLVNLKPENFLSLKLNKEKIKKKIRKK